MRIPRIYSDQVLEANAELDLEEAPSHHVLKVLRMDVGRELILFNGQGGEYPAQIIAKTKKHARLQLGDVNNISIESPLHSHIAISISRGERFELVLQKACELGVTEITPIVSERTEVKLSGDRLNKKLASWNKILISACEQCGRNSLPTLNPLETFTHFAEQDFEGTGLVLHHRNTHKISELDKAEKVRLLIGPEGGLSEDEITLANNKGYLNMRLGPRVLRTETAPLAALAILQQLWGDF